MPASSIHLPDLTSSLGSYQSFYLSNNPPESLQATHLVKSIHGSATVPSMRYPFSVVWMTWETLESRKQWSILSDARITMGASETLPDQRATLRKVCSSSGTRALSWIILNPIVFVCVAALAILDRLNEVDEEVLGWWLSERQLPTGGLNGRPEKLEDVCPFLLPRGLEFGTE